jgi:hypothetical protein
MKTLITALALAILISATQFVAAAPRDRRDAGQSRQSSEGTYKGYPLSQWYRTDAGKAGQVPRKGCCGPRALGGGGRIVVR